MERMANLMSRMETLPKQTEKWVQRFLIKTITLLLLTWFDRIQTIRDTVANREIAQQQHTLTTTYQSLHKMAVPK